MYDVHWVETAVFKLADSWSGADSSHRAAITAAAHRIDESLRISPLDAGESRGDERRIIIDLPLVAVYEVDAENRAVTVLELVVPGKRSPLDCHLLAVFSNDLLPSA